MNQPQRHTLPALKRKTSRGETPAWVRGIYAGLCLYLFLAALSVIGSGLGLFGRESDFLLRAFAYGENPFIALLGAVVATGEMTLGTAVFAIMGANIGTSVTAILVALANIRIRSHFRRSFTTALLHDLFNLMTVAVLFPFEWITGALHESGRGLLTRAAALLADLIGLEEVARPGSPVKAITSPVVDLFNWIAQLLTPTDLAQGLLVAVMGLVMMFIALLFMVRNLRGALLRHMDGLFRSYFFRIDLRAYGIGTISTIMVQSSTITTSLMVPLAGAGAVHMRRLLPFMMGSNLGTTFTSVLAATANPIAAAMTVALVHVLFNLVGTAIWYPLRFIPYRIAAWYGRLAGRSPRYAFAFLFLIFLVIPLVGIAVTEWILG
jgi:solute carrier family 34 (sodium-dependent phosphate cotransporter)